jgi:outer membrane protein OmpA-like peptidoglycan-associated protein
MAEDWLADVRRYVPDADEAVVKKIVNHCGIALRSRDASLVAFSDKKETDRVRESFLKKKLARTEDDATLDQAIAAVGERMKDTRNKNRVTVYYLLAAFYDQLDLFKGVKTGVTGVAALGTGAVAAAAAAAATTAPAPTPAPAPATAPAPAPAPAEPIGLASGGGGAAYASASDKDEDDFDFVGLGCLLAAAFIAIMLIAAVVGTYIANSTAPEAEPEVTAPPPPPPPAEPLVPDGAGVIATMRDERPMLTVYFDLGSASVIDDFEAAAADVLAYLETNPEASLAISGFNDASGNAEINAALSRDRAQSVQAALIALGVAEETADLVRPDDTTSIDLSPDEARRVEVTIVE